MNFIAYALPRSRTFWLSKFLSYRDHYCGHDEARYLRSMDDIRSWLAMPQTGTVETSAMSFWRLAPHLKTVTIRRPVDDVVDSMRRLGLTLDWDVFATYMRRLDRKLDQIEKRVPNVLRVTFAELQTEAACKAVFEYCLPYPFDRAWWQAIAPINLQDNLAHTFRYFTAHEAQLNKLAKIAAFHIKAAMQPDPVDHDDGLTIQQEPFATAYQDAKPLRQAHGVLIGEAPDYSDGINVELIEKLESLDCLQVTTARCNGRLFGYLLTVIAPSMESANKTVASNTTFFASPEFKGLGMKILRSSIAALKRRGIDEVYFYAGVRGDGPRLNIAYRRLGATPHGDWYKLDLKP